MTTILLRKSAFQQLTPKQARLIRIAPNIELVDPNELIQPPNTHWYMWDDHRFSYRDIVALGVFARLRAQIENQVTEDVNVRETLRNWLETRLDLTEPPVDEENPLQWLLDNNNAPPGIRATFGMPENWTIA